MNTEPVLEIPEEEEIEYQGNQEDSELLYAAAAFLIKIKKDKLLVIRILLFKIYLFYLLIRDEYYFYWF